MVGWLTICVRVRIQRWETDWPLVVRPKCGHYWVQQGRGVQSGEISYQLPHAMREVEDIVQFEVICVSRNDEVGIIAKLCVDEVEGLVDMIKK